MKFTATQQKIAAAATAIGAVLVVFNVLTAAQSVPLVGVIVAVAALWSPKEDK